MISRMADPSSLPNRFKYHVFLSFRGQDTFVLNLYTALTQNGITTFKNDDIENSNACWKQIEESRFAIVIFSKSFASSASCLDELVKIMDCSKKYEQLVLPVYYYDFNPSSLRRQGPVFGELFAKYAMDMEKVRAWTSVLVEAANLNGLGLIDYRYQAKQIKEIVEIVSCKLNINNLNYKQNAMGKKQETLEDTSHEKHTGIERHVQQVKELLQVETVKTESNPALPSSSSRSSWWTYDVFMCFKGDDTCKDFADQLYSALEHHNIYAFRNQALARVESIVSEYLNAIEESFIAVILFSENYAASSLCLDELVKIMNCNERFGQMVYPIFYDVDPSDVRYQKGIFGEAFMRNKPEKIEMWRKALVKAGSLAGWYLNCMPKGDEATVIQSIVNVISRRLDWLSLSVDDNLIGIKAQIKHVISLLNLESGSVHTLGICGMGGIGKTTIARAVFDQLSTCFDSSCFVENIRDVSKYYGLKHIQRVVLSRLLKDENLHVRSNFEGVDRTRLARRKVLLVLDDVDDDSQLEALVGFNKWFGDGSRIIITTRDEILLLAHDIIWTYYVKPLDDNESYQFLRRHAFKKDDSTKAYEDLLPHVISYAAGLPLALKVLSSLLCGRSKKEWASTMARLQVFPEKAIQDTLRRSYDSLTATEKEIFLDIACFFNDKEKDYAVNILNSCGFFGDTGIRILEQKSLISILKGHIKMHKLIEQMGRDIVRQMHPDEPGKRSRLWHAEEVHDILMDSKSMKEIDAIVVDDMHDYEYDAVDMTEVFRSMKNLRLLQIRSHNNLRFLEGSNYFPKSLRWLTLEYYPRPSLPPNFKGNQLVGLELLGSSISELWHGVKFLLRLCFLDLSYSTKLIKTPDFTGTPNLKELKLEYCTRLIEVHASIGNLHMLTHLSFRSCRKLETLPKSFWKLKSLRSLDLSGCLILKRRPTVKVYRLPFHYDSRMIKIPGSIVIPNNLVELDLSSFMDIFHLSSFMNIPSLRSLTFELKPLGRFTIHELLLDMARKHIREARLSEGKTSHELAEDKKENIRLLPGKKGV